MLRFYYDFSRFALQETWIRLKPIYENSRPSER